MDDSSTKRVILIIVSLAVLTVVGSFLYTKVVKKPALDSSLLQQTPPLSASIREAQKNLSTYPKFIKRTSIQQTIQGTLQSVTQTDWTLENEGKTMIVTNAGSNQIRYSKFSGIASSSAQAKPPVEISAKDLKAGDLVAISQSIDWETGKITILAVTVMPK